jgi:hypothetical protein
MASERPFIRQVWVKIDPPIDPDTGLPFPGRVFTTELFGDGSRNSIRIGFSIHKSKICIPTPSQIYIYGLSPQTRNELGKPIVKDNGQRLYSVITVTVGWQNFPRYEIYKGQIMGTFTQKQGTEIKTTIVALSGLGEISGSVISRTFSETTTLGTVLDQLSKQMGLKISRISPSVSAQKIGFKGISFAGKVEGWLNKLANEYGFSWSVLDGQLQIQGDSENFGRHYPANAAKISAKTGTLFSLMPMLSGPMQLQTGVEINALLVPNVRPGDLIPVESEINPQGQLWYEVHNITYNGDTGGSEWNMLIQSFRQDL